MNEVMEWSQGNPGAITFLLGLVGAGEQGFQIFATLRNSKIRGTDLYVLYSDLANKDLDTISKICANVPMDVLEDACSRQDYSGKELIKEYL